MITGQNMSSWSAQNAEKQRRNQVELIACKLSDGKLSIRVDGKEVHILPGRKECSVEEINMMLDDIAEHIEENLLAGGW
jgi:hypothetical protein